jgi:hypothetical protein
VSDALVLAVVGLVVLVPSTAIFGGRTELLAQYPDGTAPPRVQYGAGGVLVGYSLVTIGTAFALGYIDEAGLLWAGWTVLTVVVAAGVAGFSAAIDASQQS